MKRPPVRARGFLLFLVCAVGLGSGLLFFGLRDDGPPPVIVSITQSNGPLRLFPGINGAFFVLPDGSLWRWGQPGGQFFSRAKVPEQVGTSYDWVKAVGANNHNVGLRRDGTLWAWGWRGSQHSKTPEQVGMAMDWSDVSAGDVHAVALKRDGTLWAWGDGRSTPLGDGRSALITNLVQVGTNNDWAAVKCGGSFTLGIRSNGTLWFWGRWNWWTGSPPATVLLPTQMGRETNWTDFAGFFPRNKAGECWQWLPAVPNAEASVTSMGRLLTSNVVAGHLAFAFLKVYEVRANGELWERKVLSWTQTPSGRPGKWRQVGRRSDWVAASGYFTALGETADGTVWTWGSDPGQEPIPDFRSRWTMTKVRLLRQLGISPGNYQTSATAPQQKAPRAVMKIKWASPASTAPSD